MDTEFRYPGLHLDVDPQSFCTGDGADVRAFLDALHYDDDRCVREYVQMIVLVQRGCFTLHRHFFPGISFQRTTPSIGPWVAMCRAS